MRRMSTVLALSLAALLLVPAAATAQPGVGLGRGMGRGLGMGPAAGAGLGWGLGRGGCGAWLLNAHADVLKAQLGLTDAQLAQIQSVRTNLEQKIIQHQTAIQQLGLQYQNLYAQEVPDQGQVLDLNRKIRGLRGKISEERIKAGLKVMGILSKEQRALVRAQCPGFGLAGGFGPGWGGGWGRGGGWCPRWGRGGGWGGGWGRGGWGGGW